MFAERITYDTVYSTSQNVREGNVNKYQTLEELVTLWAETTGNVDSYYFEISNGYIVSPNTNEPILNLIRQETEVDKAEYKFFEKLNNWASNETSQNAIWASFAHKERSPYSKFIISTRQEDKILNRAFLVKLNQSQFMKAAHDLIKASQLSEQIIFSPEILRSELIIMNDKADWVSILERNLQKSEIFNEIRTGEDLKNRRARINQAYIYYSMMEQGVNVNEIVTRMRQDNFIGNQGYSCPPGMKMSGTEAMLLNSYVYKLGKKERSWSFDKTGTCQICKETTKVGPCDVCEACNDKIDAMELAA